MPRARSGKITHRRHKKILDASKGNSGSRHALYRSANETMLHSFDYAYRHRKNRKADFRRLWITRTNAEVHKHGLSYSQFISLLNKGDITVNRKILADMAVNDPEGFKDLIASIPVENATNTK